MERRRFLKAVGASALGAGLVAGGGIPVSMGEEARSEAPAAGRSALTPFSFCVAADPHCAEAAKPGIEHLGDGVQKFLSAARQMEALEGDDRPDFMLVVGDFHLWALAARLSEVKIPIHPIAGNHESGSRKKEMRELFPADFQRDGAPSDYYSFAHKGVRFIGVCDAGAGGDHVGQLASEDITPRGQCEWLEAELAAPEARKIVFAHVPPEPQGRDASMFLSRNDSRWFNALVEKARPTAMFFGHLHKPTAETAIGPTRSFIVRSCCWNFDRAPLGFMHVRMGAEGMVTREVTTGEYK